MLSISWVIGFFLNFAHNRQHSLIRRINQKLSPRFYGPFLILERIGSIAYKLQLPTSSKIHPVFHVSLLKKAMGNALVEITLPAVLTLIHLRHLPLLNAWLLALSTIMANNFTNGKVVSWFC